MVDNQQTFGGGKPRAGKQHRSNADRYFHVMGQGWYVLTREGISGPYVTKGLAEEFVHDLVNNAQADKNKESWRYNPI